MAKLWQSFIFCLPVQSNDDTKKLKLIALLIITNAYTGSGTMLAVRSTYMCLIIFKSSARWLVGRFVKKETLRKIE
jgi:hypothetical protein